MANPVGTLPKGSALTPDSGGQAAVEQSQAFSHGEGRTYGMWHVLHHVYLGVVFFVAVVAAAMFVSWVVHRMEAQGLPIGMIWIAVAFEWLLYVLDVALSVSYILRPALKLLRELWK